MTSPDTVLLEKWRNSQDPEAFASLAASYSGMVFRAARRILRDQGLAEDVTQECFMALAQTPAAVRHSLGGWLHALAVSRSLDRLKAERRRAAREAIYSTSPAIAMPPDWDDVQAYVDEAVTSLPETLRDAIVCRYLEGNSLDETARRLDIARSTVQVRLEKGVDAIRRMLRERGVTPTMASVVSVLVVDSAEAIPSTLQAALGKLAISGVSSVAITETSTLAATTGALLMLKKAVVATACVLAITWGIWHFSTKIVGEDTSPGASLDNHSVQTTSIEHTEATKVDAVSTPEHKQDSSAGQGLLDRLFTVASEGSISGMVVDIQDNPMPDMLVFPLNPSPAQARTGSDGRFTLDGLMGGRYRLSVRKSPSTPITVSDGKGGTRKVVPTPIRGDREEGVVVEIKPGEHKTGVKLVYQRAWTISGRVTDRAGRPIGQAKLNAGSVDTGGSWAESDVDGCYVMEDLAQDIYQVTVMADGYQVAIVTGVEAGRNDADFVLREVVNIQGRVLDAATGLPITRYELGKSHCSSGQTDLSMMVFQTIEKIDNPEGRFGFTVSQSGTYVIAARAEGYATTTEFVFLGEETTIGEIILRLPEGGDLHGYVRNTQGAPVAGAQVIYGQFLPYMTDMGSPIISDEAGAFCLPSFPCQAQLLTAYHPNYAIGDIVVPAGADLSKPYEIVLGQGGTLRGHVNVADAGYETLMVTITYPQGHASRERYITDLPDSGGAFELTALQAGAATMVISARQSGLLEQWRSIRVPVVIYEGQVTEVEVDIPAGNGVVEGTAPVDSLSLTDGRLYIQLQWQGPAGEEKFGTQAGPDGSYRLEGIPRGNGTLELQYQHSGLGDVMETVAVSLSDGDTFRHDFASSSR